MAANDGKDHRNLVQDMIIITYSIILTWNTRLSIAINLVFVL